MEMGPVHIHVVAIGDFTRPGSGMWEASGRRLTPAQVKAIKGVPAGQKLGFDAEALRNKTDVGRFVVLKIDPPKEWLIVENFRSDELLGSEGDGIVDKVIYLSLPKGTTSFDIPFMALNQGPGKTLLDFTEEGPKQSGEMRLEVKSHEAARVAYTKPKDAIIEKKDPLVQYIVTLDVPASWSERFLDLEAPGVVWPKSKEFDPMGPENMHGIMDERPNGKNMLRITLTIATPGAKIENQRLRLVEREQRRGVMKSLPAVPR